MKHLNELIELNFPTGTYFSSHHTWARKNKYGLIKIGIDSITLKLLKQVKTENIVRKDTFIKMSEPIFEIASTSYKILCGSPVEGIVRFINPFIKNRIVSGPFGDDWILLVQALDFYKDRKSLMTEKEYKNFITSEMKRHGTKFAQEFLSKDLSSYHSEIKGNA